MQRLGELNNKVIVEQKTAPENKYVIWKDPVEGKFKEYKDGSWVESEEIAVPGSGEITPEDITPDMLRNSDYKHRIRLYGHTVEEVEKLIEEGKCIYCKLAENVGVIPNEDLSYNIDDNPLKLYDDDILVDNIDPYTIEYILFASAHDIESGYLLRQRYKGSYEYIDVVGSFGVNYNNGHFEDGYVGIDTL